MEVSGHLHVPAALPPGKEPPVLTGYEAGILHCRESKPDRPAPSPSLYLLIYFSSSEGGAAKLYDVLLNVLNSRADQIDHRFGFRRFSNERITALLKCREDLTLPALSQGMCSQAMEMEFKTGS
jgi:hypothetical protein